VAHKKNFHEATYFKKNQTIGFMGAILLGRKKRKPLTVLLFLPEKGDQVVE